MEVLIERTIELPNSLKKINSIFEHCSNICWQLWSSVLNQYGNHDNTNETYCIILLNIYLKKGTASLSRTKQTMEMLFLPCTPLPFNRKLQNETKVLINFTKMKMGNIKQTYFARGGVTMQDDVSILSI